MIFPKCFGVRAVAFLLSLGPLSAMAADCTFPDPSEGSLEQRALVAVQVRTDAKKVYLSWRMLEKDSVDTVYNVYRFRDGDEKPEKRNRHPLYLSTNFTDSVNCSESTACDHYQWFVKASRENKVQSCSYPAALPKDDDKTVISIGNGASGYGRQLAMGELDGNPGTDYVLRFSDNYIDPYYKLWRPSKNNYSLVGFSSTGDRLWKYDMGPSIENGIWYAPYLVYDLDMDGIAEVIVKGGDPDDTREKLSDETGRIVRGNEYLQVVDGRDGQTVLADAPWPDREGFVEDSRQPYSQYNHYSRNLMAIAYLDGVNPHIVVVRGTYGKHKVHAYRYTKGKGLIPVWKWENIRPSLVKSCAPEDVLEELRGLWGQGAHTIRVGDVDSDGKDEVVIGGVALDHNGKPLWSIDLGHLDHIHLGELNPQNDGLEIYYGAEEGQSARGMGMIDAETGESLWTYNEPTTHIHKEGLCADLYPAKPGLECFSGEANRSGYWLWSSTGQLISQENLGGATLSPNAAFWGKGKHKALVQLTRNNESPHFADIVNLVTGNVIDELHHPATTAPNDWQYSRILAVADIMGDWREEVVVVDRGRLLVYTSTQQTSIKRPWLMSDHLYKMGAVLFSMGYQQQPLLGYDLPAALKVQKATKTAP